MTAQTASSADSGADAGKVARAIVSALSAIFLFASMNAAIKWLGSSYPVSQIVFCRALFALVAIWPMIAANGGWRSLRTERPWDHAWRCAFGVIGMGCGFTAITLLPLANVAALAYSAPLFTTVLGVLLLGEKVRWRRSAAIILGFLGVLVMLRPDLESGSDDIGGMRMLGSGLALAGAACAALAMISIRRLSTTEANTTIVFYFMLSGTILSGLFLPFQFVMPTVFDAFLLIGIGLVGGVAQLLLTQAYRQAPVAVVAPFDYSSILWATLYGFLIWGHIPDMTVAVGALIVIGSGVYITLREIKLGVTKAPPSKIRGALP